MANIKEYVLKINGIQETINAVDSLNKQLETLESRIKALEGKAVNISSGGGASLPKASELSEIEKIEKEIAKVQEKQAAHQSEEYKALLMEKEALKQIESQAKASAKAMAGASNPNEINLNTMAGMKQRLRDLKLQHNTTDINSDIFKEQTREINELTQKLKDLEAEYGVYSRNVGNYANGVTEGIMNARKELKQLKIEMENLTVKKDNGIITPEEEERLKNLIPTVKQLESSIADAGKPMDALMDTMKSMVAIAQTTKGFSALFGLDDDKIEKSIQKLVALQNVMQGIETLQKQMDTGEGFGAIFKSLDNFAAKAQDGSKAMQAMGKSAKFASTAIKGIGKAFGWIGIALMALDVIKYLFGKTKDVADASKEFFEREQKFAESMGEAYGKGIAKLDEANAKINSFNGGVKEEKRLVDELNKELGNQFGYYKSIAEWKQALIDKQDDYLKMLEAEIKAELIRGEIANIYAQLRKLEMDYQTPYVIALTEELTRKLNALRGELMNTTTELSNFYSTLNSSAGTSSNTTTTSVKSDSRIKAEEKIQELTLKLMKDGLRKKLIELDNDRRKTLERVKGTAEQKLHIEQLYNQLALKEIRDYVDKARSEYSNLVRDIEKEITDLEISAPENVVDQFKYYMAVNEFRHQYLKMESIELLKRKNELTRDADDLYSQLIDIQNEYYQKTVTDQLTLFDGMEEMQKEAALKRKLAAEKEALDEVNIWEEEQRKKVEDLKASIATLEELGNKANEQQKLDLQRAKNQLEGIESSYETMREQKWTNFWERTRQIQQKYETEIKNLDLNNKKERSKIISDFYEAELKKFDDFAQDIADEVSKQPLYIKGWDIINISKTRENFNKIKQELNVALENVQRDFDKLYETYHSDENIDNAILSEDDYEVLTSRLKDVERSLLQELELLGSKIEDIGGQWWGTIDKWIQEVGQATSSILSSLSDITSNHYDEMIDQQQKYYDKLSELYDKQREKTQEYANAVNQIEGELSDARGDRRQQLIDQLNAEMAAQRESLAQEKRIEKEKEKAEHRKEQLEYDQAVARKKMDEAQALINSIMAVSMAAVNHYPIPAIPMMALAASVGAAQYAAVRSQYIPKPSTYADGGVIQGNSHRDGGVPVLGGRAEVEGGEFITNKVTTANNTDLLQFINSKRKRVDISDLIDFYSSGKPSKNITGIRTKFADGGQLPLLRNDISMNDRILAAIEDYSNKPTVVQVVDIIDRTQKLNEVKVISGLEV